MSARIAHGYVNEGERCIVDNAGLGIYPHSATTFHFSIAAELEETTVMPETARLAAKVDQKNQV
jgi:hypothetical protein